MIKIVCRCGATTVETVARAIGSYAVRYAGCFTCNRGFLYEWNGLGAKCEVTTLDSPFAARVEYAKKIREARERRREERRAVA